MENIVFELLIKIPMLFILSGVSIAYFDYPGIIILFAYLVIELTLIKGKLKKIEEDNEKLTKKL